MKYLNQTLCTKTDSFSYTVCGEETPTYVVDSWGILTEKGVKIGKYDLRDNRWHLIMNGEVIESGPENGLFHLPEFELYSLERLVNRQHNPA